MNRSRIENLTRFHFLQQPVRFVRIVALGLGLALSLGAVDTVAVQMASGAATRTVGVAGWVAVDPSLTIANNSTTEIDTVTVVIGSGAQTGDSLRVTGTIGGVTGAYNAGTQTLSLVSSATIGSRPSAAEWQALLRTLEFSTTGTIAGPRIVTVALGSAKPYSGTGHFYELISTSPTKISWSNDPDLTGAVGAPGARELASARRLYGLQGYLVTITSVGENAFIHSKVSANAWMGASDHLPIINAVVPSAPFSTQTVSKISATYLATHPTEAEGRWYWVTGPEAGTLISLGDANTSISQVPTAVSYANWSGGEPNNSTPEDFAHIKTDGTWNDFIGTTANNVTNYVVEYGGMPNDPAITLQASRTVQVQFDAPTIANPATPQNVPRPVISGTTAHGETPVKQLVALEFVNDGTTNVAFVVTTGTLGAWTLDTASATPFSGTMADLATDSVCRITVRTFNNSAASLANGTAYPSLATVKLISTDLTPPAAPTLIVPVRTNDLTPTITGTAEPGSTVTVTVAVQGGGTFTVPNIATDPVTGAWRIDAPALATAPVSNLPATVSAIALDAFLNTSSATTKTMILDTVVPPAPVITAPSSLITDATPVITGTAEAGTTVIVTVDPDHNPATANSITYATLADPITGAWAIDTGTATPTSGTVPSAGFADGSTIGLTAIASDAAGNQSPTATGSATIDITPPLAPVISGPHSPTNDNTPSIVGTGEPGARLILAIDLDGDPATAGDVVTYATLVDANGNWTIDIGTATPPGTVIPDGVARLTASQRDPAGNVGPTTTGSLLIDTVPPEAPIVTGPSTPTNDRTPTISGTAEPGTTVRVVLDVDGDPDTTADQVVLTTVVVADGTWQVTPTVDLPDGNPVVLEAKATDAAGNTGPGTDKLIVIDTLAPEAPLFLAPVPSTNQTLPTLRGTADPDLAPIVDPLKGLTVTVYPHGGGDLTDAQVYSHVTVNHDGTWSVTMTPNGGFVGLVDGAVPVVYLSSIDAATNASAGYGNFRVDLVAPVAPTITGPLGITADHTPVLSGTAESSSFVTVVVDPDHDPATANSITYVTTADPNGRWAVVTGSATPVAGALPSGGFADGLLGLTALSRDPAGNASPLASGTFSVDTTVPSAPVISGPTTAVPGAMPVLTGSGEAGATVTVVLDPDGDPLTADAVTYTVVVASDGTWQIPTATAVPVTGTFPAGGLSAGVTTLLATQVDAAGNRSPSARTAIVVTPVVALLPPAITGPLTPSSTGTPVITGTATSGAVVAVTLDPDGNAATGDSVTYAVAVGTDGTWTLPLATAMPIGATTPIAALAPGTSANLSAVTVGLGGATSTATTAPLVIASTVVVAATVSFGASEFAYDGQPKPVAVTTSPQGLRVRVFWVDATTPNATEIGLDPADPADAGRWPSAAGRYRIRAVIYDPGYQASTVGELRIVRDQLIDLDARRCGFGSNIALVGFLTAVALVQLRWRRRAALGLLLGIIAVSQGMGAEPEVAPAVTAPTETSASVPTVVETPVPFRYGAKFDAGLPPASEASEVPGPVPSGWWWVAAVTRQPDISLAHGDGEQVDDAHLTSSRWATPWGVSLATRTPLPWGGDAERYFYAQAGVALRYLHGDERWETADHSRSYDFRNRHVTVPVSIQLGWEQRVARQLWLDVGASAEAGPAIGDVEGIVVLPNASYSAHTTTYGITAGWALNAALWYRWADDHQGLGVLGSWGNSRTSFSYRVEESLDGIDRERSFDRRLDADGFSVGLGYRWLP